MYHTPGIGQSSIGKAVQSTLDKWQQSSVVNFSSGQTRYTAQDYYAYYHFIDCADLVAEVECNNGEIVWAKSLITTMSGAYKSFECNQPIYKLCSLDRWAEPSCTPAIISNITYNNFCACILYANDQFIMLMPIVEQITDPHLIKIYEDHFESRGTEYLVDNQSMFTDSGQYGDINDKQRRAKTYSTSVGPAKWINTDHTSYPYTSNKEYWYDNTYGSTSDNTFTGEWQTVNYTFKDCNLESCCDFKEIPKIKISHGA